MTKFAPRRPIAFAAAIATTLSLAAPSVAHEGATGVVKQRMHAMKMIAGATKRIKQALAAKPYDPNATVAAARQIEAHAGDALTKLYPKGSAKAPSEARPEIWSDWPGFQTRAATLAARANALAVAAGETGPATSAFQALVKACAACHTTYRAK